MKARHFKLEDFIGEGEAFHLARAKIQSRQDLSLHNHDYAEMFWVEEGSGWHHINKQKIKLKQGHLVMVRPEDIHTFSSSGDGVTIMNLAFPLETLEFLRERYFQNCKNYFWIRSHVPYQTLLSDELIRRISSRAEQTFKHQKSYLQLDSLLLFIFRLLTEHEKAVVDPDIPVWLFNAIQNFNTPHYFQQGASGFALLCEKNIDHVNRIIRKYLNKSLTDLVNELRMQFASQQLIITSTPIKKICLDCGYTNLGHFYKVFKSVYKLTPSQYRKINQKIV